MLALGGKYQSQQRSRSTMQSIRADMQALQKQTEEKLADVLTEEQMKIYKKVQEERMEARRGGRGRGQGRR